MKGEFQITCPVCKVERSVNKCNYIYHTKKGGTGKCKDCYLVERNNSEHNKRKFVNGVPAKKHPYYQVWRNMIRRCYDPKVLNYKNYGGRGIETCKEWMDSRLFLEWVDSNGEIPPGYELDRRNNNGNYEPSNCRFVPPVENAQNRRSTKLNKCAVQEIRILHKKGLLCIERVIAEFGITERTLKSVIAGRTWKNVEVFYE